MTIDELVEDYGKALRRAALANAVEAGADETRKVIRAEMIVKCGDVAVSKAENIAMASPEYKAAVHDLWTSRKEAEEARAEVEHLRVRWETWRSKTSSQKARLQHG